MLLFLLLTVISTIMAIIIALRLIVIATIDKDTATTNNLITLDIGTMVYLDGFQDWDIKVSTSLDMEVNLETQPFF
uniref:Uncharacterized protein n=1 Tax=Acrobeloides nanus TaxID=290746 RepID=A0A914EEP1_9BILA